MRLPGNSIEPSTPVHTRSRGTVLESVEKQDGGGSGGVSVFFMKNRVPKQLQVHSYCVLCALLMYN